MVCTRSASPLPAALDRSRASIPADWSTAITSAPGKRRARANAPLPVPDPRSRIRRTGLFAASSCTRSRTADR